MNVIICPYCCKNVTIDISKAIDEFGEEFICSHCHNKFRYAPNG